MAAVLGRCDCVLDSGSLGGGGWVVRVGVLRSPPVVMATQSFLFPQLRLLSLLFMNPFLLFIILLFPSAPSAYVRISVRERFI